MDKINVFCLPFAGGSKYSFWSYQRITQRNLNLIPLELPGRGSRMEEPLMEEIHAIVADIFEQLTDRLYQPYALYGHSMGSLLGYLLTEKIIESGYPQPLQLFFSGSGGPAVKRDKSDILKLPRTEFFAELKKLGGVTEELLCNTELMDIFEPVIRADFRALSTYAYQAGPAFNIPMTIMIGTGEKLSREEAMTWQQETKQVIKLYEFPGDHFFIFNHADSILQIMSASLMRETARKTVSLI